MGSKTMNRLTTDNPQNNFETIMNLVYGNDGWQYIRHGGTEMRTTDFCLMLCKEHPEPVYPSWEEGWKQLFPESSGTPCPANYGKKYRNICCVNVLCVNCKQRPMPAEIAEKLGIKPVAPETPAPEHDGCEGCKWIKREETDEPCVRCKGTMYGGDSKKPDL